jgi:hypothetical protein
MFPSHLLAWNMRICGQMTRRRQATDAVGLVARLAGLAVLISLFFPAVRQSIATLGFIAVGLSVLTGVGLVGFGIYRLAAGRSGMRTSTENPFAPSTDTPDENWDDEAVTTLELLEPALRRRYPWRHGIADHL